MRVADVAPNFESVFAFDEFNRMQAEALPAVWETDENAVIAAPTASGKTALAKLAICRTLAAGGTALFVAPMRALTEEKEAEFAPFEELGYTVTVVTGDRELDPRRAARADILVVTPEKLDSATRKHDSPRYEFVTQIDTCVLDEVHLLDSTKRGPTLEVTVARLRRLCDLRIIALSATMQNVEDVADWLEAPRDATFQFGQAYRPVDLETGVRTYSHGENSFADKYRRLYRALDLAEPHLRDDGQALVFVASRQDAKQAAKKARDELAERDVPMGARGDYDLHTAASELGDETLAQSIPDGVAFHHAGLSSSDREQVEQWFRDGRVDLLFSTTTLAWGVNLPARCVVIRDTNYHDPLEGANDINPLDVIQMLGRAGRPGYDDVGYGYVVCDREEADKYRRLLTDGTAIESRLADGDGEQLAAHLNAEIALGTIDGIEDVMDWLETTFYYIRARSTLDRAALRERVREPLDSLIRRSFVTTDGGLAPTTLGRIASSYYLRLETAARFRATARRDRIGEQLIFRAVAQAAEFDSVSARADEQDAIDTVVGDAASDLADGDRKVLAVLQAAADDSLPPALRSDAWVIQQNATRLLAALREVCAEYAGPRAANLVCRVQARIEQGVSPGAVGLTAVEGIGANRAERLARGGLATPADVAEAGSRELQRADISAGVADRLVEQAADCPRIVVEWGAFPDAVAEGDSQLCEVTVRNLGGGTQAALQVFANGVKMHETTTYLDGERSVPVAVFGAPDESVVEYAVEVVYPELPIPCRRDTRRVRIR